MKELSSENFAKKLSLIVNQETNKITKITFIYYLNSLPVYQIVFPSEVICFEALNVTLSYKSTTPAERGHFKMPKRWKIFNKDIYEFEVYFFFI